MLTAKQELFAKGIAEGKTQCDAYRAAYNAEKMSDNAVYREASLLMNSPKIAQRLKELRDMAASSSVMTARQRLEWLTNLIGTEEEDVNAKLKAIDIMNKMQGEYVQKIAADVQQETTITIELVDDDER